MQIEPGEKTDEPIRTRGWTYWHHLLRAKTALDRCICCGRNRKENDPKSEGALPSIALSWQTNRARLSQWRLGSPGREDRAASADGVEHVFYNQALNTFYNFGARAFYGLRIGEKSHL